MNQPSSLISITGIILIGLATISAGALLLNRPSSGMTQTETTSVYILGPARSLLAKGLYERADIYFHKGATYDQEEAFESIFTAWANKIAPTKKHAHAHGNQIAEILPWLRLASKSDPHNIEIYTVATFWLCGECNRPDLALEAINEAIENNPDRYELLLEKGRINLALDSYKEALTAMENARDLLLGPIQKDPEQAAIDQPFIYLALSYLYESEEMYTETLEATKFYLSLKHSDLNSERLKKLESEMMDPKTAKARLRSLFHKEHECERECECENESHDHEVHVHSENCSH